MTCKKIYRLPLTAYRFQNGITLIETIVALFVLTTGLIAGLSLAIHSFTASADATRRDVAAGLAREGIEVVRRLRDSNWLSLGPAGLADCGGGEICYTNWLSDPTRPSYAITGAGGAGIEYRVMFNPATGGNNSKWTLSAAGPGSNFRLYTQGTGGINHTVSANPTPYFRKVAIIYADQAAPYSITSPLVLVRSTVWWTEKRCPVVADPNLTTCKIVSEEYLTNWKNY